MGTPHGFACTNAAMRSNTTVVGSSWYRMGTEFRDRVIILISHVWNAWNAIWDTG